MYRTKIEVINTLKSFLILSKDWDGYGGVPPNVVSVSRAVDFINNLSDNISLPNNIMVSGSGLVGLVWKSPISYISIDFYETGECPYLVETNSKTSVNYISDELIISLNKYFNVVDNQRT